MFDLKEVYSDLIDRLGVFVSDKFILQPDGRIKWWTWTPACKDKDSIGEFMEHYVESRHIIEAGLAHIRLYINGGFGTYVDPGLFFGELASLAPHWLHDETERFRELSEWFINDNNFHIHDTSEEAMGSLLLFAGCDENQRVKMIKQIAERNEQ